jgi:hypothetical protein
MAVPQVVSTLVVVYMSTGAMGYAVHACTNVSVSGEVNSANSNN